MGGVRELRWLDGYRTPNTTRTRRRTNIEQRQQQTHADRDRLQRLFAYRIRTNGQTAHGIGYGPVRERD